MKKIVLLFAVAVVLFTIVSCKKNTSTYSCDIDLSQQIATKNGTLTYTITSTGTVSVSSVSYINASGTYVTETNPTLPFTKVFNVTTGDNMKMNVKGTTNSGTITAKYSFVNVSGGATFTIDEESSCGN
ncbi:MAG: hypothetical protein KF781_02850 [Chitinophagaceae bacterium]|nr:hypothetical protein [Chitinophagaceae bacterium]MCW5904449.1 hypothetical protein [Chitinophagaceae bacterium]